MDDELRKLLEEYAAQKGYDEHPLEALANIQQDFVKPEEPQEPRWKNVTTPKQGKSTKIGVTAEEELPGNTLPPITHLDRFTDENELPGNQPTAGSHLMLNFGLEDQGLPGATPQELARINNVPGTQAGTGKPVAPASKLTPEQQAAINKELGIPNIPNWKAAQAAMNAPPPQAGPIQVVGMGGRGQANDLPFSGAAVPQVPVSAWDAAATKALGGTAGLAVPKGTNMGPAAVTALTGQGGTTGPAAPVIFGGRPQTSVGGVIPGGFMRTTDPESIQAEKDLRASQETTAMDTEINQRLALQKYQQHLAERGGEMAAEQQAQEAEVQRQHQAMRAAKDASEAADRAAQAATIDPHHLFTEMGTGGTILATIGVALGAIGAGFQSMGGGGVHPNQAMQIINSALDRDMHAQEANLNNKRASAGSALAKLRDQTGSLEAAKLAYKQAGLQYAQNQLAQLDAGEKGTALQAGLSQQLDQLKAQQLDFHMKTTAYRPPQAYGGATAAGKKDTDSLSQAEKETKGRVFKFGGQAYVAQNDKSWEELHAQSEAVTAAQNLMGQIKSITADSGWRTDPTKIAEMDSLRNQVGRVIKKPQGDSSDKDAERLFAMQGDPTAWLADGSAVMQKFVNNQTAQMKNAINTQAAEPAQTGYKFDAQGNPQAVTHLTGQSPDAGTMPTTKPAY